MKFQIVLKLLVLRLLGSLGATAMCRYFIRMFTAKVFYPQLREALWLTHSLALDTCTLISMLLIDRT
jgi:hypothetical protein